MLLGVAAMLVLIFILVILPGTPQQNTQAQPVVVSIKSNPEIAVLSGAVGEESSATLEITTENEVAIYDVRTTFADKNFNINNTCVSLQRISKDIPCQVNLTWKPVAAVFDGVTRLVIEYGAVGSPREAALNMEIQVSLNATDKASEPAPVQPEPAPAPIETPIAPEPEPIIEIPEPIEIPSEPEPILPTTPELPDAQFGDGCYDFSFMGYDLNGRQFGWIRPNQGRYLFHTFDDSDCSNPIGEYDINTGFITDIKDYTKKIGTDAERINVSNSVAAGRAGLELPRLGNPASSRASVRAGQLSTEQLMALAPAGAALNEGASRIYERNVEPSELVPSSVGANDAIISSARPYDRRYVLRQFKPIPATIVNDVRADERVNELPVRAVVERNVYSDNERNIIVPSGTLLLGYVTGVLPGPYKTIGRLQVNWYQMIRPDGVEFHLGSDGSVYSADSQGRVGIPGRGSTDYLEEMLVPMAAALVPAAVNLIAPISDRFVNQIDLDNNTIVQSGTMRSSELAKQEIVKSWDKVTQRLVMDMMGDMTPPFTIPAGTRITVLSNKDLVVNWDETKLTASGYTSRSSTTAKHSAGPTQQQIQQYIQEKNPEWLGQVRATGVDPNTGKIDYMGDSALLQAFRAQADNYQAQYVAQQQAYQQAQAAAPVPLDACGKSVYLNLVYEPGTCNPVNPALKLATPEQAQSLEDQIFSGELDSGVVAGVAQVCNDGTPPDINGCCPSAGEQFVNDPVNGPICCLIDDPAECFPPLI